MPPQTLIEVFKPGVREAFEKYLNTSHKARKLLMNATRQTLYLRFLSDPEQKIVKPDKNEKSRLYTENFEQSMSFVLIIGASSFMLV